jgi:hypothetical protein
MVFGNNICIELPSIKLVTNEIRRKRNKRFIKIISNNGKKIIISRELKNVSEFLKLLKDKNPNIIIDI